MKRKRTIIIKDPKLQKIRNNFRILLLKWGSKEWKKLHSELLSTPSENINLIREINRKKQEIMELKEASICKCASCAGPDKDMTYNPVRKEWFCVDCYRELQDFYKDKQESFLYP